MLTPIVALFLLAASAGAASAAPIAGAIVGLIGLTGLAGSVATGLLTIGLSLGASALLSSLLKPGEQQASVGALGATAELRLGGKVPHEVAFGEVLTSGHYIYWNSHGANRRYLDQVYVLASCWCDSLTALYVNGEAATLTQTDSGTGWTKYAVTLPDDGGTRRMWVTFWEGRHDQTASAALIANANPSGRWTSDHIGVGQCYAHVEADYDANLEAFRGLLNGSALKFRFRGARLYDPRLDTTAGGTGSHRFDDWTTWEWSEIPAVACYHYQRGFFVNGVRVCGMALPGYDLVTEYYMAAANICDEAVALPGGGTEPRYRVAMFADDDREHVDAVDRLVSAMAGERLDKDGIFAIIAGAAQAPVAALTDDDLIADRAVRVTYKRRREDLVNELYGKYSEPDLLYESADIEAVIGDSGVKAEDGGETRAATVDLPQVTSATQGRRLLLISWRRGRQQATADIVLGLDWRKLEVGDWITWRGRTWSIAAATLETEGDVIALQLSEIASSVYALGEGDVTVVPLPPTPPGVPARPTNVSGLTVQAVTLSGADGQALPGLAVSWDAVTDQTIRTVELEFRREGETGNGERRTVARPASGDWDGTVISGGLMAGTDYEVRSTITTFPARVVTWSTWRPITTLGEFIVKSAGSLYDEATGTVKSGGDTIGDIRASIYEQLNRMTDETVGEGRTVDRQERTTGHTRAAIQTVNTLIATESEAVAEQFTTVNASIGTLTDTTGNNATAISGLSTRVTETEDSITAISASLTSVQAQVGDVSAEGFYRLQATAGPLPGDVSAEFAVALNTGTEGTPDWQTAGLSWQILSGGAGSRGVLDADQVVIRNGSEVTALFQDGTAFLNDAVIPTLTADKVTVLQVVGPTQLLEIDTITPFIRMRAPTP